MPNGSFAQLNRKIKRGVVGIYKKIENTTVSCCKTVEKTVVTAYKRIENAFVDRFLAEAAIKRLKA